MSERLRIEISGDEKDLKKAIDRAIKDINEFEKKANQGIGNGLPNATGKAAKGMKNLQGATANATPTLQEFSRVIQDAPFGIVGVGNNITQLVSNFGNLQKQTGSAGGAFKALIGSLAGPGGVLFAISTIVTLLTVFSDEIFKSKDATEDLAQAQKDAAKQLDNYILSLNQLDQARLKGAQSAQQEIVQLNQLRKVAEDTTQSNENRLKAVQELRRLFPDYFKDLTTERILTGNLTDVYKSATAAILERAKATAATNLLVENAEKEVVLARQLAAVNSQIEKQEKALSKITGDGRTAEIKRAQIRKNFETQITDLLKERLRIQGQLQGLELSDIELSQLVDTSGGIDLSKVELKQGDVQGIKVPIEPAIDPGALAAIPEVFGQVTDLIERQSLVPSIDNILTEAQERIKGALINLNQGISSIINSGLVNALSGIGEAIEASFSSGGDLIGNIGASLLGSLGGVLVDLGKMAIGVGVGLLGIETALKSLNPAAAIGVGVALVAIGSAFKKGASKLGNSLGGGGGQGTGSISRGGSQGGFSASSVGGQEIVFRLQGTDLIAAINANLRLAGSRGGNIRIG